MSTAFDGALADEMLTLLDVYDTFEDAFESLGEDARKVYAQIRSVPMPDGHLPLGVIASILGSEIGLETEAVLAAIADLAQVGVRSEAVEMENQVGSFSVLALMPLLGWYEDADGFVTGALVGVPRFSGHEFGRIGFEA